MKDQEALAKKLGQEYDEWALRQTSGAVAAPRNSPCGGDRLKRVVIPARCPHCGGKAELESRHALYDKTMERNIYFAEVECVNRYLCGARLSVMLNDEDAARTQCVEQWNRRYNASS